MPRHAAPIIKNPCDTCLGQGRVRRTKTLAVKIPAGVDTGDRIRLSGEGEAGRNGGPPGDLYVEVHVREHEIFERDGEHLSCEVPVSFATAVLGGSVEVPTLDGHVSLKIPSETQSGRVFRLRDKGVKPVRGGPVRRSVLPRGGRDAREPHRRAARDLLRKFEESLAPRQHSGTRRASRDGFEGVKKLLREHQPMTDRTSRIVRSERPHGPGTAGSNARERAISTLTERCASPAQQAPRQ